MNRRIFIGTLVGGVVGLVAMPELSFEDVPWMRGPNSFGTSRAVVTFKIWRDDGAAFIFHNLPFTIIPDGIQLPDCMVEMKEDTVVTKLTSELKLGNIIFRTEHPVIGILPIKIYKNNSLTCQHLRINII